jgi:hypothetical protein
MTMLDMVHEAVRALGDVPADAVTAYVRDRYGVAVKAAMVPVLRASLRERELLARFREESRALAAQASATASMSPSHVLR